MQPTEFIADTLSHFVRGDEGPPPGVPAHANPDFERQLTWLCEWHGVTPIVVDSLQRLALKPRLSRVTFERMKALARASSQLFGDVLPIQDALARKCTEKGITAAWTDGAVLARLAYPRAELRPLSGLDLLVADGDWSRAIALCREEGFTAQNGGACYEDLGEALVFHQVVPCVLENERGDRVRLRLRVFDAGGAEMNEPAWERAGEVDGLKVVAWEDTLIRSSIAFAASRLNRLLHATDIAIVLDRFGDHMDWDYLTRRLTARSAYTGIYFTLEHVAQLFKLRGALKRLERPSAWRRKRFHMLWDPPLALPAAGDAPPDGRLRFYFLEVGRWPERVRFLARLLAPRRQWVASFFQRPYRPHLRVRFIVDVLRGRSGAA